MAWARDPRPAADKAVTFPRITPPFPALATFVNHTLHQFYRIGHEGLHVLKENWLLTLAILVLGLIFVVWVLQWFAFQARAFVTAGTHSGSDEGSASHARQHQEVHSSLRRLSPEHYTVFDDLYLPRLMNNGLTHLDFVVVSRQGIFVVQVEDMDGEFFGSVDEQHWLRLKGTKSKQVQNPLWRNIYHVKALAHFLRQPESIFRSVIFYSGEVSFKMPLPENVLTGGLGSYICNQPVEPQLTDEVLHRIHIILGTASRKMNRDNLGQAYQMMTRRRSTSRKR